MSDKSDKQKKKKDKDLSLLDTIIRDVKGGKGGLADTAKYNPAAAAAVDLATSIENISKDKEQYDAGKISGKDMAYSVASNAASALLTGRLKQLKHVKPFVQSLAKPKEKPATTPSRPPGRSPVPQPNPALPLPGPSRGPSRRVRPRRKPEEVPTTPAPAPKTPTTPTPAPVPVPAPTTPAPAPVPAPSTPPGTKPTPTTTPTTKPAAPKTTPVVITSPEVIRQPEQKPIPQNKKVEKTTDKKKPFNRNGMDFNIGRRIQTRDLRTMIGGTGVKEEYIAEEETRFKKFKVMYILGGQEKTNVYRYKGKDTMAKARVLRQLRERGAGSIRFMQYESVESNDTIIEHEIVRGEDGRYYDDEGNSSRTLAPAARKYMVGDNYQPKKNYGYGYKDNNRRKALPTEKIYHKVSYKDKDEAKAEGMRWDGDAKKWYHTSADRSEKSKFKKLEEAYMPDATRKPVVYRAPPKRGEVVGKMKVRLIRRHQDVMPGERTATSDNTKRLRKLIRKVLKKGKLKK